MNINNEKEAPLDYIQQEDFENTVNAYSGIFSEIKGSSFLITGATGLVGSQIVKTLLCCNRMLRTEFKIIGLVRNIQKAKELYGSLFDRRNMIFVENDLCNPVTVDYSVDYIIHTASITASKIMVTHPVDVIRTSVIGTDHVLSFAKEKMCKSIVYISSMEAYGIPSESYVTETDLGYIDLNNPRSCYPESKRACECLCKAYSVQYGLNVKSIRLAQTFGPGILESDNRVFVQFAKSVMESNNIVLHTAGNSEGNYCYLRDAIKAIFTVLFNGQAGETYNVSNEKNHMTIAQMAHLVATEVAVPTIEVIHDIPDEISSFGYAPDTKLKLNTAKIRSLGWEPEIGLRDMYLRMIESMKVRH